MENRLPGCNHGVSVMTIPPTHQPTKLSDVRESCVRITLPQHLHLSNQVCFPSADTAMATVLAKRSYPPQYNPPPPPSDRDGGGYRDGNNSPTESKDPNLNVSSRSTESLSSIPPLGIAVEERRFWFQRAQSYDPTAIATQVSVFDDPDTAEKYQPRADW